MYPVAGVSYPFFMSYTFLKTKKADDGTFYCNSYASKLKEPNPNNFKGKIYVLINGGSFSASCLLSSALKANKEVTFVGEETGGDFNGTVAGFMPQLTLPNSHIKWRLGLLDIRPVNQTKVIGHGIYPDKEIIQTVEDKINGNDPELEWILKQIGK
jgi:C-terminal processing protease CtpA/Prc